MTIFKNNENVICISGSKHLTEGNKYKLNEVYPRLELVDLADDSGYTRTYANKHFKKVAV